MKFAKTILILSIVCWFGISVSASENSENKVKAAPVLVLYPLGDKCEFRTVNYLEQTLNTYVKCVEEATDESWIINDKYNVKSHGEQLCEQVKQDDNLKHGNFSIVSLSLGGMMARYIIEYCPLDMPIRNVVTLGAPLNGISAIASLPRDSWVGYYIDLIVDKLMSFKFTERLFQPSDYWKEPEDYDHYVETSRFLAEANNEVDFDVKKKTAWTSINKALFIKFADDSVILPKESAWWGEYDEDMTELDRHDSYVYQEDLVGIKTLEDSHKAQFVQWPGDHMAFNYTQINDWVLPVLRS
eukprot:CAMPEP_0168323198 /NCGR_PEP_ID=MMETSP0213-20121227/3345_1 /TAXON_ID=151035 /ORGANISM="Euplotes harpa, Strain FSP1.4" /LENGTH=298 /DNA_ID=CAMNT_0008325237 /DNA_START=15 /DNA_END=911 /DNA_ORIENTATION=+